MTQCACVNDVVVGEDEITAIDTLERFSHTEVRGVVGGWFASLRPGGRLRLSVPDVIAAVRLAEQGYSVNLQHLIMGAHDNDTASRNGSVFSHAGLVELLISVGFERLGHWVPEGSHASPCYLNVEGYKPVSERKKFEKVAAVLSAPRYGPVGHFQHAGLAFGAHGIPYRMGKGVYWQQILSEEMEARIADGCRYIITSDYDSIFTQHDVAEMLRLMEAIPELDALCPVQSQRGTEHALFGMKDPTGKGRTSVNATEFDRYVTPIETGHFGLTVFRVSSLANLPRPWMVGKPNADGRWGDGRIDPDIEFWQKWKAAGYSLHLANRVVIGHIDECMMWPGRNLKPVFQSMKDYYEHGIPAEVRR